jgi:glycosyltransferase involved in cell wall biosynthesis
MVLFLHNRYRTTGGEERVVEDLLRLVRQQLDEPAELLTRDSATAGRARAARGLVGGGSDPAEVATRVRLTGARVLHAHNLHPTFGWRALAAARQQGARVVLHLHQYRLVCATGVCFTQGAPCTRCHGRNTLPGVLLNCRGNRAEAVAYGLGLALWQRRTIQNADAVIVPSQFARQRLLELGAPLPDDRVHVLAPPVPVPVPVPVPRPEAGRGAGGAEAGPGPEAGRGAGGAEGGPGPEAGPEAGPGPEAGGDGPRARRDYALVVSRLSPEKGVDVAIEACRLARVPLIVAGEGPQADALRAQAAGGDVRFLGRVEQAHLAELRAEAAVAVVPSRSAETFGLAAAEAMAAGLPVVASHVGALPELVEASALVAPGNAPALAEAIERLRRDARAGARALQRVAHVCAPEVVATKLAGIYDSAGNP